MSALGHERPKATCALSPFDSQLRTLIRASRRSHSYGRHQSRRLIWSGGRSANPPAWSKWSPLPPCYAGSHRAHVLSPQGFPADRHPLRRPSLALLSTAIRRSKKCAVRAALQRTDAGQRIYRPPSSAPLQSCAGRSATRSSLPCPAPKRTCPRLLLQLRLCFSQP